MDSAPSVDTVYQAVTALYNSDTVASEKSGVWLGDFQKSLFAWEISDKLLSERRDQNSSYFAAHTIRQKLLHNFHELPPSSHISLRDSLLNQLGGTPCDDSNSVIITQLCLAFADLYLQVPQWNGFVGEFLQRLSLDPSKTVHLLCLLRVFPEENAGTQLRLGHNRRRQVHEELAQQTGAVLTFLSQVCTDNCCNEDIVKRVFACLSSWLQYNPAVPTDQLADCALLKSILQLLNDPHCPPSVHDSASDCVVSALYRAEDTGRNTRLATTLQLAIYNMLELFHSTVAVEDFNRVQNLSRLFIELAETLLEDMIRSPGQGLGDMATLELLVVCIGYHDYTVI